MPTVIIRTRQDRNDMATVQVNEKTTRLPREVAVTVTDAELAVLQTSHEAPYVMVQSAEDVDVLEALARDVVAHDLDNAGGSPPKNPIAAIIESANKKTIWGKP